MPKSQHEHNQLIFDDVVNYPVVANPNTPFTGTSDELHTSWRARILSKCRDRYLDAHRM